MRYATPVFVLTLLLGACGGGEERVLTAQEYAQAMEDAEATLQEEGEKLGDEDLEEAFEEWFEEFGDRLASPDSGDSLSDEDAELASELSETLVRAFTDSLEGALGLLEDYGDELSSLRPPAHLAELHEAMAAGIEEFVRDARKVVEDLKDIDTDIETQDDLVDFWTSFASTLESDLASEEQVDESCQELQARLEAELNTSVAICD